MQHCTDMPKGHTAEMSGVITILSKFAVKALVVSASEKDAVAIAFYITLANNDVAEPINLCGVHGTGLLIR